MEIIKVENLSFTYPDGKAKAIDDINLSIKNGEFITICGKSGCGKTTLLRLLKTTLSPFGSVSGSVKFCGRDLNEFNSKEQAAQIGFVMQNPDNQIVTDKVWHELAFGLESLGVKNSEIRTRVAEMAVFFGIEEWFHKKVTELSGGQKQLLNLASVMVMQPSVLILDEPTSQLDPIGASEFFKSLERINRELGTTVIISEHSLEEAFSISNRVIVMDKGRIIADAPPNDIGDILCADKEDICLSLPTPIKIHSRVKNDMPCPVTVREGRIWLKEFIKKNHVKTQPIQKKELHDGESIINVTNVYFKYEKDKPDIIKGLNLQIRKGEIFAIVGGNGAGKTTALSLISGLNKPYRGDIEINGRSVFEIDNLYNGVLAVLPQNPQSLFVKKTVYLDMKDMLSDKKISESEKEKRIKNIAELCDITSLLSSHPYDLSGGEQQRVALSKLLLRSPSILLLDEPTKGLDICFKYKLKDILYTLKQSGVTTVIVSHDIEFCAEVAERCAMFFDGSITATATPRELFCGNSFYTTSANRMAGGFFENALLAEDVIYALGGEFEKRKVRIKRVEFNEEKREITESTKKENTPLRIMAGVIFALLFFVNIVFLFKDIDVRTMTGMDFISSDWLRILAVIEIMAACFCFIRQKEIGVEWIYAPSNERKFTKRTAIAAFLGLIAVPLTIYIGVYFLGDRKYYFISLLIILETMLPFCMVFEKRKPQARELVVISVLCAVAVAGRAVFFMVPQFKPVIAIVIIAGVCFGGETGFLVGSVSGFVSNFFFGQGPWTPWQMFAFGITGFISGELFRKGFLRRTKQSLCIFGFFVTIVIYGGIMNPASVIMWQNTITKEMIISSYVMGAPFDLIHAVATAFFLWFISEPMIEKLERIKIKYGLIEK